MAALIDLARAKILWIVIAIGLSAGLIGAYGRERNNGLSPDGAWWLTRFCILPFFAIVGVWAADQFHLNGQQAALVASLLSLMGYEAVRIITDSARRRAEQLGMIPASGGGVVPEKPMVATPRPFATIVDSDEKGRATAHVVLTPGEGTPLEVAGEALVEAFDHSVQATPDSAMQSSLRKLNEVDDGDGNSGADPAVQ